jgi:phospholipid-binding lipoprotein MlaA
MLCYAYVYHQNQPAKPLGAMKMKQRSILLTMTLLAALNGCATLPATPSVNDPWEDWNRDVQSFNDDLDAYFMKPIAEGYDWAMPSFAHRGVTNFFSNIDDIGVGINALLQGKFIQTGEDIARFLLNTTLGLGGFIDVASEIDLIKHKEDFDQTLGVWGVPSGPYLVIPFFGPGSPRSIGGLLGDMATNPINYLANAAIPLGVGILNVIDMRANNLALENIATEAALDRYIFLRNAYFSQRNYLILDGLEPKDSTSEFDIDKALDEKLNEEKKP